MSDDSEAVITAPGLYDRNVHMEEVFLDVMHPILCYSCAENVASRVDEYEDLCDVMSEADALDRMGITGWGLQTHAQGNTSSPEDPTL